MLTEKQKELLLFIHERMQDKGVPPSFDEMKDALDLKSKSGIHRLITALVERGFIRRLPHRARAIEVIRLPENAAESRGTRRSGFQPSVIEGSRSRDLSPPPSHVIDSRTVSVPVMGRIAAGTPISAIQNHTHDIACPPDLLTNGEHFALEVKGDSMIEAGILDGDIVVVRRCDTAENGDIVVALVELGGGHVEAAAQEGHDDCAGSRQSRVQDAHLRPRPGGHPGPPRGAFAPVLISLSPCRLRHAQRVRVRGRRWYRRLFLPLTPIPHSE